VVSANTNATAIMIGEKAADLILGQAALPTADNLTADRYLGTVETGQPYGQSAHRSSRQRSSP
jgi:choline dehydrogenase-like flavoprotein